MRPIVPQDSVQVLAVPGSLRRQSHNRALLRAAAELAPEGMTITVYDALHEVPVFNEDLEAPPDTPPGVTRLREAVQASDGLLVATPEYNQSMPGVVKNMIDWLSRSDSGLGLEGKPVAITGVTTGPWGTRLAQTLVRQTLTATQALVMPQPMLYLRDAETLFDDGALVDESSRERLADFLVAFSDWIRLFPAAGRNVA